MRNRRLGQSALASFALMSVIASGCTPRSDGAASLASQSSAPAVRKVLTIALSQEPALLSWELAQTNVKSGGAHLTFNILHNYLVVQDDANGYAAQIAVEKPSVENGLWRLNADGSMDLTWKLRPNVKWHDGTLFTPEDLIFSLSVYKDADIPTNIRQIVSNVASATKVDPTTIVVHWSSPYVDADQGYGLQPLPKHLLEETYLTDKANFASSPRLSHEFVGLGPYKLTKWEAGSHMELTRFDDYFMGRPPLDSVVVRFFPDGNTLIANVLSGTVDMAPPIGLDPDATLEVKRRWEGTANQAISQLRGGFRVLEMQHRPEYAKPSGALTSLTVRQAFYHAIDRPTLADTMSGGISPVADSWMAPTDFLRPQLADSIPQFAYDPARSAALLTQTGWTRASDGSWMNARTSEKLLLQLTARGSRDVKEQQIIAANWKAIGGEVEGYEIPPALQNDREATSTLSGAWLATLQPNHLTTDRFHSRSITSAANRWTGNNRGGYSNPRVDSVLDRLVVTIPATERISLYKELAKEELGDLPIMNLYWEGDIMLAAKGLTGTRGGGNSTWNMFQWDKN